MIAITVRHAPDPTILRVGSLFNLPLHEGSFLRRSRITEARDGDILDKGDHIDIDSAHECNNSSIPDITCAVNVGGNMACKGRKSATIAWGEET